MGNKFYDGNIYLNDKEATTIKFKYDYTLTQIKEICKDAIPSDKTFFFISKTGFIIMNDANFTAYDVVTDKDNGKRIDLKTREFFEDKEYEITIYLNDQKHSGLKIKDSMSLVDIKRKAGRQIDKNTIYYLTKNHALIEQSNINDFKTKDIITEEGGRKRIDFVEGDYYKRLQIIDHLRLLDQEISEGKTIDWFKQREFFKKIEGLAGEAIANAIKEELSKSPKDEDESETDDGNSHKKYTDKDYIKKYMSLLLQDNNMNSAPTS